MSLHSRRSSWWARLLVGVLAAGVVTVLLRLNVQDPKLPQWQLTVRDKPPEIARCAACHELECDSVRRTPHWNTLRPSTAEGTPAVWGGAKFTSPVDGWHYEYEVRDGQLWLYCSAMPGPRQVNWLFGSGTHAQTPVSTWTNPNGEPELIEHRVTRYATGALGLTLGRDEREGVPAGLAAVGKWHSPAETRQCFGCHSSHLPHDEHTLRFDKLLPGVRCSRCHSGSAQHATAMESGTTDRVMIEKLSGLSPLDLINRCGECHRRADQFPADELVTDNQLLVRFAPVGLALSRCFQAQPSTSDSRNRTGRMDCLTCHDPHQPSVASSTFYLQKCLACHSDAATQKLCPQQPQTSDCLTCHMPKSQLNSYLSFTDHWIRIRSAEQKQTVNGDE